LCDAWRRTKKMVNFDQEKNVQRHLQRQYLHGLELCHPSILYTNTNIYTNTNNNTNNTTVFTTTNTNNTTITTTTTTTTTAN
jgi:hypothetical protein